MEEKRMIEILKSQLGLNITTDISEFDNVDCVSYSESTADGYDVYVRPLIIRNHHIYVKMFIIMIMDIAERIAEQIRWGRHFILHR